MKNSNSFNSGKINDNFIDMAKNVLIDKLCSAILFISLTNFSINFQMHHELSDKNPRHH